MFSKEELLVIEDALKIADNEYMRVLEENRNNKKETKSKNVYYTVHLNDIYSSYDDKTLSEEDMIEEIKKETSL